MIAPKKRRGRRDLIRMAAERNRTVLASIEDGYRRTANIVSRTGYSRHRVTQALAALVRCGTVERVEKGRYRIARVTDVAL